MIDDQNKIFARQTFYKTKRVHFTEAVVSAGTRFFHVRDYNQVQIQITLEVFLYILNKVKGKLNEYNSIEDSLVRNKSAWYNNCN